MIELKNNKLTISFPEVHKDACATIEFKRTLRIPDDGQSYPLPPGFSNFELRHVEDYAQTTPEWQAKGGVMMSMYQAEALWLDFNGRYPIALKVGTGKINAIDGANWTEGLGHKSIAPPEWRVTRANGGQNYIVIPEQPWLDGYCVGEGLIAQFVAMALGQGATAEEQISGSTQGGIQLQAFPLKAEKWEAILEERRRKRDFDHCVMDDQVASLKSRARISHVRALHSGTKTVKTDEIYDLLVTSLFVFISPERFLRKNFREALAFATHSGAAVGLAVIDEAHCVSMWGHDFRPAYLELAKNIRRYGSSDVGPPPILALSGTASQLVLIDLSRQLRIYGSDSVIRPKTFDRPELNFRVLPTPSKMKRQRLLMAIKENAALIKTQNIFEDRYGLIFGVTKKSIVDAFTWLFGDLQFKQFSNYSPKNKSPLKTSVGFYTGSCPDLDKYKGGPLEKHWTDYKKNIFEQFVNGSIKCMVANNALSVGIDHPKIRYVINLSMVGSLESYYQQAGRAGIQGVDEEIFNLQMERLLNVAQQNN